MDVCATDLFWYLVEKKGQVVPATGASKYSKTVTMKEEQWERFKTIQGMTGRMASDYTLSPAPAESDLDEMSEVIIEPKCHPHVLYDKSTDLSFSQEIGAVKKTVEQGKKSRFEGGDAKNYGRNYVRKQFVTLDMNRDVLRKLNVSHCVTQIDEQFATEVPNLQELSLSGHALKEVRNLPPKLISLNAHCNRITEWPQLPNNNFRNIGLSGNLISSLDALPSSIASSLSLLTSLDLSNNKLKVMRQLAPLEPIPLLSVLKLAGNPLTLLPNYRPRVVTRFPTLTHFDGSPVLDTERTASNPPPAEEDAEKKEPEEAEGEETAPPPPLLDPDDDGGFCLLFTLGVLEGLKDPNPAPPPSEAGNSEEPREEQLLYDFYVENPPVYYLEVSVPSLPASSVRTEKLCWAQTPRDAGGSADEPIMDFAFEKRLMLEASPRILEWLRYEGVQIQLFAERRAPPEPPPKEGEEGEEGGAEVKAADEDVPEAAPVVIVTPLGRVRVDAEKLVMTGAALRLKAELEKHLDSMVTVRPVEDKMVEEALKAAREADRVAKKGLERKKTMDSKKEAEKKKVEPDKPKDDKPKKKLIGVVEFSVQLNPLPPKE